MLIIFNKRKIYSYLVASSMVVILFLLSFSIIGDNFSTVLTSSSSKELPIYSVQTDKKQVALTMNCAWSADDIDSILNTLEQNNVKITFFTVGDWVDKNPDAVKKIAKAGHEIGNHSDTHPHVNNLSSEENKKQIEACSKKIETLTGNKTTLYRAPYGEYNNVVIRSAREVNHTAIQWNIDTLDYTGLTGQDMWARVSPKLSNGSIILMHNGTTHTADSLDMLIKNIKSSGYEITTVSNLIYKDGYVIDSNGVQKPQSNIGART